MAHVIFLNFEAATRRHTPDLARSLTYQSAQIKYTKKGGKKDWRRQATIVWKVRDHVTEVRLSAVADASDTAATQQQQ